MKWATRPSRSLGTGEINVYLSSLPGKLDSRTQSAAQADASK